MAGAQLYVDEHRIEELNDKTVDADPELRDHIAIINASFAAFDHILHSYQHQNVNELTVLRLGVRMFNAAGAGLKLARAGYYQPAFAQIRDLLETSFLLDYFKQDPSKIEVWRTSDHQGRKKHFSPHTVRKALEAQDDFISTRHVTYSNLSEYAAHPAPEGFVLISPNNMMTQIGPFPDEDRIRAFLQDLARFLASATMTFAGHLSAETAGDLLQRVAYMRAVRDWSANRVPGLYERLARDLDEIERDIARWKRAESSQ
jgi:hypothetical protein